MRTTNIAEICNTGSTQSLRHWSRERDDHILAEWLPMGPHPQFEIELFPTRDAVIAAEALAIQTESPLFNIAGSLRVSLLSASKGARLAREFTAGTVALLEYYVRNWGHSPEQREPLSDTSLLPKLSEVEPFLSAEQREIITSAQARLHALQVARYER